MMEEIMNEIRLLFQTVRPETITRIEKLPQSGSDRIYFRIHAPGGNVIATYNDNRRETRTFVEFSRHFKEKGIEVPEIIAVNADDTVYLQEDLGNTSLLMKLEQNGHNDYVFGLFKKSLQQLARLQIKGHEGLKYDLCLTAKEFGKQAVLSDLLYCKYYFLDTLKLPYDKQALLDDFEALSIYLTRSEYKYFLFRDFQSRNILVDEKDGIHFIDYQGGMQGALQYDVASLLWQAKAALSDDWKDRLLECYLDELDTLLEIPADRNIFISRYHGYVLIRLVQVLGAYGFRGLFERKAHFLSSIPLALLNLRKFLKDTRIGISMPEFSRLLHIITSDAMIAKFQPPTATGQTPLVISINSFSFKKEQPADENGNGGGFVFDCRGILNPGRFPEYKAYSGKDKPVQDFLEQQTRMPDFLNSIFDIIDITVEDYLKRDFSGLQINFGCTGGQHRSVYAAEQTARHLKNKYRVQVVLNHKNENYWQTGN